MFHHKIIDLTDGSLPFKIIHHTNPNNVTYIPRHWHRSFEISYTLVGLPVGILYEAFYKKVNRIILPIGLLTVTRGFFILYTAPNLPVLIAGVLMTGIGFGLSIPYIYTWTAEIAPKNAINISYTLLLITINIGVFCSPLLLNAVAAAFNNYSPAFSMMVAGSGFLLLFIFITLKTIAIKTK
ncbi:hypothetical protein [Aerococcus urinaeequi]|uniref:hypothetical protein n=1 Tax=Aerococcus urinaeequi TaxID=51665 RepID=UPI003D6AD02B